MNRTTSLVSILLLAMAPFALGQREQPNPQPPDTLASQQLVAWSWMQKPRPAPQPLPSPDTPIPQSEPPAKQPGQTQAQQQTAAQSFTGKIVRDGDKYVLKVTSNTAYRLNDQTDFKQYENQDVRIVGRLDRESNTISVEKIELLS